MPQDYPRTEDGLLNETRLAAHTSKIPFDELKAIIRDAIVSAACPKKKRPGSMARRGRAVRIFPALLRRSGGDRL
jgi:hypothetical protein